MGRLQLADNHPKEGLYHLKQAVGFSPDKAVYHFWLGIAYSFNMESNLERENNKVNKWRVVVVIIFSQKYPSRLFVLRLL
jgi:hypothetical protein